MAFENTLVRDEPRRRPKKSTGLHAFKNLFRCIQERLKPKRGVSPAEPAKSSKQNVQTSQARQYENSISILSGPHSSEPVLDQASHPRQNKGIHHSNTVAAEEKGELEAPTAHGSSSPRNSQKNSSDGSIAEDGERSTDLWMHAYESLKTKDPKVMKAYELWLSEDLGPVTSDENFLTSDGVGRTALVSPRLTFDHIGSVIKKNWEDHKIQELVTKLSSEPAKVREQGEKAVNFILWSKPFVLTAICDRPYTALAWSGVLILLPFMLKHTDQSQAMIKGLNEISDLLRFYKHKQSACLQDPDEPAHVDLLKTIQELYADIFEYQVRLICLLAKRWSKVGDNTIALNDWISMLKRVKDSDGKCNEENNAVLSDEKAHLLYENETYCIERSVDIRNYVIDTFEASRTTRREEGRDKNDAELLATIASDYKSDKDSVPARVPGTCEWFFEDERFLNWRSSKSSSVLWLSAGPGFGKSVLSRALVDEKRVCNHITTSSVCYFFFKDGQERRTRGAHSLSAILHQLFENTDLISHALPTYRRHGQTLRDNFSALWDILVRSAKDVEAGDIICIFDALDECEEDARDQLISKLTDFALQNDLHQQFPFSLKFLVTSRPYDDIEGQFERLSGTSTYLRINGDEKSQKVGQEIDLVIDAEIPKIIGDFTDEGRQLISDSLKTMNNRTYLWLYLTIDIIKRSRSNYRTISSIKALMRDLPPKVSDAYSRILDRSSNEPLARKLLQMVVVAIRPLSLMEANVALALAKQPDCASHKMLELCSSQTLKSTIQNICGLFVTIHDEKLSLIHQTAREFLVQRTEKGGKPSDQWQGCFDMATANSTMFRICLSYLNLEEFDPNQHQYEYDDQLLVEAENDSYPFFNYAALHWTAHYNSQKSESAKEEQTAAQTLCDTYTSSPKRLGWWQFYFTYKLGWIHSEKWTGLGIASFLGLIYVVQSFLEEGLDFNTLDSSHNALHLASHAGHETIVRILFDKGADINGRTMNETALHIASRECQEKVVQVLIHYGADVNAETLRGNALKFASAAGNNKILKMLLERGAKMDDSLYVAAFRGHDEVVKTLLESGADVNEQNEDRESALHRASFMGYEKVVQILLEYRANVKAENKIRATTLHLASHQGHDNVVQMLLRHGAEINAKDANHETALHYASSQGCEIVVQTLLKHGADVNAQPAHQQSALQTAALRGYNKIVEILVNHGADVNAQDPFGKTALQTASEQGDEVMVQTLLENGADVCQMDLQGRNSLHLASAKGERKIVENLVENIRSLGLNLKKVDGQGRNCLHHAACGGFAALVSWFIEKGMDPNIADLNGWTALHWAAKNGLSDDTDWAAQNKSLDTVEVLLRAGAKSTVEAIKGWTPYLVAVFHDNSLDILNVPRACEPTGSGLSIENVAETSTTGSRSVSPGTWTGIMCNGCSLSIFGPVYRCLDCEYFNHCFKCNASSSRTHVGHGFRKVSY